MGEYERGVGSWDGRRYRIAGSFEELPKSTQCALERDGQSIRVPSDWLVLLGDLRPEVLVCVPYWKEVADLVEAGPSPRQAGLGRPAFLVDTRRPVELRGAREIDVDPRFAHSSRLMRYVRSSRTRHLLHVLCEGDFFE